MNPQPTTHDNPERAKRLASRPYRIHITHEIDEDGKNVFVAENPEFLACLGTGDTLTEAIEDLAIAREEIILHLLDHNESVPQPEISPETSFEGYFRSVWFDASAQYSEAFQLATLEPQLDVPKSYHSILRDDVLELVAVA